ncbi:MAG: site-specific integrase [Gammaproteobacteria bacterium]|nr:site-specific integrase [Gammaproteobacteria bacterium]
MCQSSHRPQESIRGWLTKNLQHKDTESPSFAAKDYQWALSFLYSYRGSKDTFGAYRRELERFLQWSWFVKQQSFLKHKRQDIEEFAEFCLHPPKLWIGLKNVARFKNVNGEKQANKTWKPFVVQVSKRIHKQGIVPLKDDYQCSQASMKVMFNILSSFYNFLLQEEVALMNPVALIRQKSKFIRKEASTTIVRRLSEEQWQMVIGLVEGKTQQDEKQERTLFILSCLYSMYLRISELITTSRWSPRMKDFFKDHEGNWWLRTVGKGNKARQIAVSPSMLKALKRYRSTYLKLPPYPLPDENFPLIGHVNNSNKPLTSDRPLRYLVQACFDEAADQLELHGQQLDADVLRTSTVHWLRHTGISEDVKIRPREHVRDDAGHSSSAITDRYIDVELTERAKSAKKKLITKNVI